MYWYCLKNENYKIMMFRYLLLFFVLFTSISLEAQSNKIECLDCVQVRDSECYECSDKRRSWKIIDGIKVNGKILTHPLVITGDKLAIHLLGDNGKRATILFSRKTYYYSDSGKNLLEKDLILEAIKVCAGGGENTPDILIDNGDGSFTHTSNNGVSVTWGVSLVDNEDGTFSLVDINNNVLGTCDKGWTEVSYDSETNSFIFNYPDGSTEPVLLPTDILVNNDNNTWTHTSVNGDIEIIQTADVVDLGNGFATITDSQGDEITVCLAPCPTFEVTESPDGLDVLTVTVGAETYVIEDTDTDCGEIVLISTEKLEDDNGYCSWTDYTFGNNCGEFTFSGRSVCGTHIDSVVTVINLQYAPITNQEGDTIGQTLNLVQSNGENFAPEFLYPEKDCPDVVVQENTNGDGDVEVEILIDGVSQTNFCAQETYVDEDGRTHVADCRTELHRTLHTSALHEGSATADDLMVSFADTDNAPLVGITTNHDNTVSSARNSSSSGRRSITGAGDGLENGGVNNLVTGTRTEVQPGSNGVQAWGQDGLISGASSNVSASGQRYIIENSFNVDVNGLGNVVRDSPNGKTSGSLNLQQGTFAASQTGSVNKLILSRFDDQSGDNNTIDQTGNAGEGRNVQTGNTNEIIGSSFNLQYGSGGVIDNSASTLQGRNLQGGQGVSMTETVTSFGTGVNGSFIGTNSSLGVGGNYVINNGSYGYFFGSNGNVLHDRSWITNFTTSPISTTGVGQAHWVTQGGYYIYTNFARTTGAELASGSSAWAAVSARKFKENLEYLDYQKYYERFLDKQVYKWNYIGTDFSNIGMMADDFYEVFDGIGEQHNQEKIETTDGIGAAMILIMAQAQKIEDLEKRINELEK